MQIYKISLILFLAAILAEIFYKQYEDGKNSHLHFKRNNPYFKSLKLCFLQLVMPKNVLIILLISVTL